ncbi:hypothetical protein [Lacrimispora sp.]|uniref:hypothetical protein n=1 Tax=Lacrimispora sp. TaxID=2719234 RepID=UPI0028B263C8|nr:hypothetical protein [Lacrimispora sp.]
MVEQNEMEKIDTSMMEHLCDHRCRFPWEIERKEDIEAICAECEMDKHVSNIVNTYNAATQLQAASEIVRNEFIQKGDWYRALVNSIYGYLRDTDGSEPWGQMARDLADRIVGIEPMELLSEAGSEAGKEAGIGGGKNEKNDNGTASCFS